MQQPAWIMDGDYGGTLETRVQAADTVILLDLSPLLCVYRALTRALRYFGRSRPDMARDCPEKIDLKFLRWVWRYRRDNLPRVLNKLEGFPGVRVIRLRSPLEVRRFLDGLPDVGADSK